MGSRQHGVGVSFPRVGHSRENKGGGVTTIVAVQEKGNVVFASDSQTSWGSRKSYSADKVFVNGSLLIGAAGDVRVSNVFETAELPQPDASFKRRGDVYRWLISTLVPALQKVLEEAGTLTSENGETRNRGAFLVAANNQVFELSSDFAVTTERSGRYAIGSGGAVAIGALSAGASPREAVKIATLHDAYSGGTVTVKNSSGGVK